MKTLYYTFRTFPWLDDLKNIADQDIFVFGNLKNDFENFKMIIETERPDLIIGVAKSPHQGSQFEAYAINNFNSKKIDKESNQQLLELYCPNIKNIIINDTPTNSFCNWTMFKIAQYLKEKCLKSKLIFIHIVSSDIRQLKDLEVK
jgi:hypothetical protein